jgi:hypothetical protein
MPEKTVASWRRFNQGQRAIFLHGNATTLPIWNWMVASSEQSQVPIIFRLETIVL